MSKALFSPLELRASAGLAGVYALRMFGMFILLPIFALYAAHLPGGDNHLLVGFAMGSYGLTQALLQLPFGMLSDRIGRKRVIYIGLILFAVGSVVAAFASNIYWVIVGRVIQGSGAISAAVTALLADLTREENRTKAMAMIGASIGVTFAISLVAGPLLEKWIGVPGIFLMTGVLAISALIGVRFLIPKPALSRFHSDAEANPARLRDVLRNTQLLRLNFGIFALHSAQMAMFTVMPFVLLNAGGLDKSEHWKVYLPVVLVGFILMIPAIIIGETRGKLKQIFLGAIALMLFAQLGMALSLNTLWEIVVMLGLYFVAFNILEASLPSLISKLAPADAKGTAIGVYNTAQSIGIFVGGAAGGWMYAHLGTFGVFAYCSLNIALWLMFAFTMRPPLAVKTQMYHIGELWQGDPRELSLRLGRLEGVKEAVVIITERVAYLKVLQTEWDEQGVEKLIQETY